MGAEPAGQRFCNLGWANTKTGLTRAGVARTGTFIADFFVRFYGPPNRATWPPRTSPTAVAFLQTRGRPPTSQRTTGCTDTEQQTTTELSPVWARPESAATSGFGPVKRSCGVSSNKPARQINRRPAKFRIASVAPQGLPAPRSPSNLSGTERRAASYQWDQATPQGTGPAECDLSPGRPRATPTV